jgi:hypothetical protein
MGTRFTESGGKEKVTARANSAPTSRAKSVVAWNGTVLGTRAYPARNRLGAPRESVPFYDLVGLVGPRIQFRQIPRVRFVPGLATVDSLLSISEHGRFAGAGASGFNMAGETSQIQGHFRRGDGEVIPA